MRNINLTFLLVFFTLLLNCNNTKAKEPELLKKIKKAETKEFFSLLKPINNPEEPLYKTLYDGYSISINSNASFQELIFTKEKLELSKVLKFYYENPEIVFHLYKSNFDNIVILIEGRDYYSSNLGVYYIENTSNKIIEIDDTLTYNQDNPETKGFKLPKAEITKNGDNLKCKIYLGDNFLFDKNYIVSSKIKTEKDDLSKNSIVSNNINKYLNNKDYFIKTFDINNDEIDDKIVSHNRYKGDELLIFLGDSGNNYNFAFKTKNFSTDGGNQISDIKKIKPGFIIITKFPDRGNLENEYYLTYSSNKLFLQKIVYKTNSWQDDYSKTYICSVLQNIDLSLERFSIKEMPDESDRDKLCEIEYSFENNLTEYIKRFSQKNNKIVNGNNRYAALLKKMPMDGKNIIQYNDIAYYLEQSGLYKESIYLLKEILKKDPNRVVAWLNLADAQWGNGEKKDAKSSYQKYISLMKFQKKDLKKIPQRVYDRSK